MAPAAQLRLRALAHRPRRGPPAARRGHRRGDRPDLLGRHRLRRRAGPRPPGRRPGAAGADLPPARRAAQGARPGTCASTARSSTPSPRAPAPRAATRSSTSTAASACCSPTPSKGRRELPNDTVYVDGAVEPLGRGGTFVGQHICTPLHGVAVQINAFNFPVWGPLEKLAPGVPRRRARRWSSRPARPRSSPRELVELIVESGLLPEGALQFVAGGVGDLFDHLTGQDLVAFTGSASTAAKLRTHPVIVAAQRAVHRRGRLAQPVDPRPRRRPRHARVRPVRQGRSSPR